MKWKKGVNKWFNKEKERSPWAEEKIVDTTIVNTEKEDILNDGTFAINAFKDASDKNLKDAVSFLEHRYDWATKDLKDEESSGNIDSRELKRVILNPSKGPLAEYEEGDWAEIYASASNNLGVMNDKGKDIGSFIKEMEQKKEEEFKKSELLKKKQEEAIKGRYQNFHFLKNIGEDSTFEAALQGAGTRCAMLMTDTFYTRDTDFYKRIVNLLDENNIPYVEFTNIQPNLDRKLLFRLNEFASDHEVNTLIPIGSSSTIEIAKILLPKLMKPNIIKLHKTREFELAIASQYSVFSIPTFVVPDPNVNSRSAIDNHLFLKNINWFRSVLYLKNEIDDSDGVFYCESLFDLLSNEKLEEALHETFFKLIFCYFDLSANDSLLSMIIENLKKIEKLLDVLKTMGRLEKHEKQEFMKIYSFTMDGRLIVDVLEFWLLYKLEGALSLMVNSKKSDGLALFIPVFFEVLSEKSMEFSKRALRFSAEMYRAYSIEGCVFRITMHLKKYGLATSLLDIEQVKKVDYRFLSALLKKARIGLHFGFIAKAIMKNVRVS